ncbi:hypothetical protein IU434_28585, partial [Nocardia farcinica]|uniref:S-4TM family putative pore-forming effector n=1 Tax=Nocardia farcinica TaxID=37329 RepID=UPI001DC0FECD
MAAGEFHEHIVPDSRHIADNQNEVGALRLLLAQRRLYSMSKRWLGFRWLGMLVIAVMAPPVAVIWPKLAVIAGAVAGLWVFLGRTILLQLERNRTEQAAAVQECFDFMVYGMPSSGRRPELPSLEAISLLAGPDDSIESKAQKEKLLDWYPIDRQQRGIVTVAIWVNSTGRRNTSIRRCSMVRRQQAADRAVRPKLRSPGHPKFQKP